MGTNKTSSEGGISGGVIIENFHLNTIGFS